MLSDSGGRAVACYCNDHGYLLFFADLPAFGYATYELAYAVVAGLDRHAVDANVLENDIICIEFDPGRGGVIKSIREKHSGRELIGSGECAFGEMKGYFPELGRFLSSADSKAEIVINKGLYESEAVIRGRIGEHPFTEKLSLRSGEALLRFSLEIDWKGSPQIGTYIQKDAYSNPERAFYDDKGHLNMYFPTAVDNGTLWKGAPFDVCKSSLDDTYFSN